MTGVWPAIVGWSAHFGLNRFDWGWFQDYWVISADVLCLLWMQGTTVVISAQAWVAAGADVDGAMAVPCDELLSGFSSNQGCLWLG